MNVVFPPIPPSDKATGLEMWFTSDDDLKAFSRSNRGCVLLNHDRTKQLSYEDLKENSTYTVGGAYFVAISNELKRNQVEDKVLEFEAGTAVKNLLGSSCHLHFNVKFTNEVTKKDILELDSVVVHAGGENIQDSEAYVIECQLRPPLAKVQKLLKNVELFKQLAPTHPHFKSVTKFVPVLGGRLWDNEIIKLCNEKKVWRIEPSGNAYRVVRTYCTLAVRCLKHT